MISIILSVNHQTYSQESFCHSGTFPRVKLPSGPDVCVAALSLTDSLNELWPSALLRAADAASSLN